MSLLSKIFGNPNEAILKKIRPLVEQINSLEPEMEKLDMAGLRSKTSEFRKRLAQGELLENLLPEAYAVVRETAKRVLGQRHFDVQLLGGIVLHRGQIAEMKTGEGKTLTSTTAVYLNALTGQGVHVVTVNDYLAKRDTVWMGQIYHALGLSVGCIQQQMMSFIYEPGFVVQEPSPLLKKEGESVETGALVKIEPSHLRPCNRREAYQCDITYGTNNEFGFDYLRDNMVAHLEEMAQRPLHFAIIDEIDSILIDEARTPLIISAPAAEATEKYYEFAKLVAQLEENVDFNIDEKMRSATLTEAGIAKLEKWLKVDNLYTASGIATVHHIEQALKARTLFKRDRDYVVREDEVIIVDEFTGRLMFGRRYSEGLHQAIEAKEGATIQRESETLATVTFQNYFRLYKKLAGMTGTAATEAEEFSKIYNLEVVEVTTNKSLIRVDLTDRIYKNEIGKFTAVIADIKERQTKGQPALVGTISIEKNEALSLLLEREGIQHQILNAKNHEREAEIIAQAGKLGTVTLATNMAGRGVDIILGGTPPSGVSADSPEYQAWKAEHDKIVQLGGLHVIGTERHESRRIDNQLRGRAGRQGDAGSSQFYVSLEDDLMRIFGSERIQKMMDLLKIPEDMPIENRLVSKSLEAAQRKVEGNNFDIRKHLLEYDDVINKHRQVIYKRRHEILEDFVKQIQEARSAGALTADNLETRILELVEKEIEQVVFFHTGAANGDWNFKEIEETLVTIFPLIEAEKTKLRSFGSAGEGRLEAAQLRDEVIKYLFDLAKEKLATIKQKINNPELWLEIERGLLLRAIDMLWVEHLVSIDHLRTGIGLRGYGQRDPLVEYKKETYRLFSELLNFIQKEVAYSIYKIDIAVDLAPSLMERQGVQLQGAAKEASAGAIVTSAASKGSMKDASGKKVGRNDPCPCGAKKADGTPVKYKKCHGQ